MRIRLRRIVHSTFCEAPRFPVDNPRPYSDCVSSIETKPIATEGTCLK